MVSVVMITYGHEQYIKQAIEGVLIQQCDFAVELIIANDCSPDNTDNVVDQFMENHPNSNWIKYTRHNSNKGMILNFIWALEQANGKYIALCEGDDYWTDALKLQKQVDFLEVNPKSSMCFTSVKKYYQNKNIYSKWHLELKQKEYSAKEIIYNLLVPTCSAVFRNEENCNYDKLFNNKNFIFPDMILWLFLLGKGSVFCLPFESAVYRRNESSVTADMPLDLQLRLLKQHEEIAISFNDKYKDVEKKYLSRQYMVISLKLFVKKDSRCIEYFRKSISKNIFDLPNNLFYILSKIFKKNYSL
jgi:glycosyltransferase involved in cell wall biosynthesis